MQGRTFTDRHARREAPARQTEAQHFSVIVFFSGYFAGVYVFDCGLNGNSGISRFDAAPLQGEIRRSRKVVVDGDTGRIAGGKSWPRQSKGDLPYCEAASGSAVEDLLIRRIKIHTSRYGARIVVGKHWRHIILGDCTCDERGKHDENRQQSSHNFSFMIGGDLIGGLCWPDEIVGGLPRNLLLNSPCDASWLCDSPSGRQGET